MFWSVASRRGSIAGASLVLIATLATAAPALALPDYDGDGVLEPADCDPLNSSIAPGKPDTPDLSFRDTNCDGIDGNAARAVFVRELNSSDGASGTKDNPVRTLQRAIDLAAAQGKDVYVAGGTYARVDLRSGVGVYGGYVPTNWSRNVSETTTVTGKPEAALAAGATNVVLQLLTLVGERTDDQNSHLSVYGLRATKGAKVALERVTVRSGPGWFGDPGDSPAPPPKAANGANGKLADSCQDPGDLVDGGGVGFDFGQLNNSGGYGGAGGTHESAGNNGGGGGGNAISNHGIGGKFVQAASEELNGGPGGSGGKGSNGESAHRLTFTTALAGEWWAAPSGGNGGRGDPGTGGGGGGGGAGRNAGFIPHYEVAGGSGGGGGAGGWGGRGGTGGESGGGSFGIYLHDSVVAVNASTVQSGPGGAGGAGGQGAPGGLGGDGRPGGQARHSECNLTGGNGGHGGAGGPGGDGGHGAGGLGGPSVSVFRGGNSTYAVRASTLMKGPGGAGGAGGGNRPASDAGASETALPTGSSPSLTSDFDGDGIADASDACTSTARGHDANADGCPDYVSLPDDDGDRIPNSSDACPTVARGSLDVNEDGCPDAVPNQDPGPVTQPQGSVQPARAERIVVVLSYDYKFVGRRTRLVTLRIRDVPRGSTVKVTCSVRGKRCPGTAAKPFTKRNASRSLSLKAFTKVLFKDRTRITVTVTKPGMVGAVKQIAIRTRKRPRLSTGCLEPGSTTRVPCT